MTYPAKVIEIKSYAIPFRVIKWPSPTYKMIGGSGEAQPGTAAEAEFVILNETEVQLTEAGP